MRGPGEQVASADGQNCAAIKSSTVRLACFDSLSKQSTTRRTSGETKAAIADVLKTLRKLDSATSIGINIRDYSVLVRDSSADIQEDLRQVPDGDFKDKATEATQANIDANTLWARSFSDEYVENSRSMRAGVSAR